MSELENDLSEKRPVKKKIIRKKIIKRKPGEVIGSQDTETRDDTSDIQKVEGTPVRRIIKRKGVVRKHARESVEEVLGKKIVPTSKEQEKIVEYKAAPAEEDIGSDDMKAEGADEGDSSRVIRRRVVKKKPAIKRVIKKKAVTRRLARETIEQVLGKKLEGEEKKEEEKTARESTPEPVISALPKRKAVVTKKVSDEEQKEREIQKPVAPAVIIPPDWKEKKIASYKKKPETSPIFSPLPKDTKLNERYKIMELIHSDCYGCVYRVTDLKEKNKDLASRAIKEIQYSISDCNNVSGLQEAMNMLKRIASFLQDMSHPFLTKIYDYFFDIDEKKGARFFVVMELVEGKPLEEILLEYKKEGKSLSAKHIFKTISNICDAMYYSHNKKP
ncbi:MAG: protein kinase, partial [Candidatus Eremiobacterota bacterium]